MDWVTIFLSIQHASVNINFNCFFCSDNMIQIMCLKFCMKASFFNKTRFILSF